MLGFMEVQGRNSGSGAVDSEILFKYKECENTNPETLFHVTEYAEQGTVARVDLTLPCQQHPKDRVGVQELREKLVSETWEEEKVLETHMAK